jgi:hypothetical protein
VKSTGPANPLGKVAEEIWKYRFDLVADPAIIRNEEVPVDATIWQCGIGHAANDGNLRPKMLARRRGGCMDHRHAVLNSDRLSSAYLHVNIAPRQAGQNQSLFAMTQMATNELGADSDRQSQSAHGGLSNVPVRHRCDEIAAKADENLGAPIHHCLYRVDDVMSMRAWWLESEHRPKLVEEC